MLVRSQDFQTDHLKCRGALGKLDIGILTLIGM
jgi:hypothetical protein